MLNDNTTILLLKNSGSSLKWLSLFVKFVHYCTVPHFSNFVLYNNDNFIYFGCRQLGVT